MTFTSVAGQINVHSNATLTTSGSSTFADGLQTREYTFVINIKGAPTGTNPTLKFSLQEVDPGDTVTPLGPVISSATFSSATTQVINYRVAATGIFLVSWTVTGTTPSFTGVYVTLLPKPTTSSLFDSRTGQPVLISGFGDLKVGEFARLIGGGTEYNALSSFFSQISFSSGSVVPSAGITNLNTGTAVDGYGQIVTWRKGRFITGLVNHSLMGISITTAGVASNIRRWGLIDTTPGRLTGAYFMMNGTSFGIGILKTGVETFISVMSNNPLVLDNNFHVYEIDYNAGKIIFFQDSVLIHNYVTPQTQVCDTLHLRLFAESVNSGSTSNSVLGIRGCSISRYGKFVGRPSFMNINNTSPTSGVIKNTTGSLHKIVINITGLGDTTIKLYDGLTNQGQLIATIDALSTRQYYNYDLDFDDGLYYEILGGNPGDITITFD